MENQIDEVVAPNLLTAQDVIQSERQIQNRTRVYQIPIKLTESNGGILLNGEQIVKNERDIEAIKICRRPGDNNDGD